MSSPAHSRRKINYIYHDNIGNYNYGSSSCPPCKSRLHKNTKQSAAVKPGAEKKTSKVSHPRGNLAKKAPSSHFGYELGSSSKKRKASTDPSRNSTQMAKKVAGSNETLARPSLMELFHRSPFSKQKALGTPANTSMNAKPGPTTRGRNLKRGSASLPQRPHQSTHGQRALRKPPPVKFTKLFPSMEQEVYGGPDSRPPETRKSVKVSQRETETCARVRDWHARSVHPPPPKQSKIIGRNDLVINPWLFKIKMESDYIPPPNIKEETMNDQQAQCQEPPLFAFGSGVNMAHLIPVKEEIEGSENENICFGDMCGDEEDVSPNSHTQITSPPSPPLQHSSKRRLEQPASPLTPMPDDTELESNDKTPLRKNQDEPCGDQGHDEENQEEKIDVNDEDVVKTQKNSKQETNGQTNTRMDMIIKTHPTQVTKMFCRICGVDLSKLPKTAVSRVGGAKTWQLYTSYMLERLPATSIDKSDKICSRCHSKIQPANRNAVATLKKRAECENIPAIVFPATMLRSGSTLQVPSPSIPKSPRMPKRSRKADSPSSPTETRRPIKGSRTRHTRSLPIIPIPQVVQISKDGENEFPEGNDVDDLLPMDEEEEVLVQKSDPLPKPNPNIGTSGLDVTLAPPLSSLSTSLAQLNSKNEDDLLKFNTPQPISIGMEEMINGIADFAARIANAGTCAAARGAGSNEVARAVVAAALAGTAKCMAASGCDATGIINVVNSVAAAAIAGSGIHQRKPRSDRNAPPALQNNTQRLMEIASNPGAGGFMTESAAEEDVPDYHFNFSKNIDV